jgi:hypothetical protein
MRGERHYGQGMAVQSDPTALGYAREALAELRPKAERGAEAQKLIEEKMVCRTILLESP